MSIQWNDPKLDGVREVFLIGQGKDQCENLSIEEVTIVKEMGLEYVIFHQDSGVYKNQQDAIAVAKKLIENKPSRNLAVISAIKGNDKWK